jgi:TonB-linked SusC/RagA family outer membrane protein
MQKATLVSGQPVRHPYITKTWKVMKLTGLFLFALSLHVTAKVNSQTIDFSGKDIPLEKVFSEVEKQTGFFFFYNPKDLANSLPVTVEANHITLNDFLILVFKDQPLKFRIDKRGIIVSAKPPAGHLKYPALSPALTAPPITGKIVDAAGRPLAGATITVKGTKVAVVSDGEGAFIINANRNDMLVISYVGYISQEVSAVSGNLTQIKLIPLISSLDQTVVIAYGTSTKRKLTGSVGKVTSEEIEKQPVLNPLQALQGRVAGLNIIQGSGLPGTNFTVQIRGQNSLRNTGTDNGNAPLYVIDGVPFLSGKINIPTVNNPYIAYDIPASGVNPLNTINANDIASVEILKDADATAIYGSRGANGVILITTKKGKTGLLEVDANIYAGAGKVTRKMNLMNTQQYLAMRAEAFKNDNATPQSYNYDVNGTWDTTRYTDWQKTLIGGVAKYQDAQITISGGSDNTKYRIGGNYHRETSVFPGDFSDRRAGMYLSLTNASANQKFRSTLSIIYSNEVTTLPGSDLTSVALTLAPNAPALYDNEGKLNWENNTFNNPVRYFNIPYNSTINNLIGNIGLSYELIKGLTIGTNLGYTTTVTRETSKRYKTAFNPTIADIIGHSATFGNGNFNSWLIEPQLNYASQLGKGKLEILIGTTFQNQVQDQVSLTGSGFLNEALMDNISAAVATTITSTFAYSKYRYSAGFGRINYSFLNKYIFNITGRRDGSTRFGPNKQSANFGAIGSAWIFSQEKFVMNNLLMLSFGKLRVSYGSTGNDQIPNYGFLDNYMTSGQYQSVPGLIPARLFNPDYGWEINKKFEVALELGFIKDRILLSSSYYNNRSSNQLVGYSLPPTTGFGSIQANLPATVQNTGLEFELSTINIQSKNISWTTAFNLTIPKNKLVDYPNLESSSYQYNYVIGEPLNIYRVYHFLGVDPETGLYKVQDVNKDGLINLDDLNTVVFVGQKFYGGLQNSLTWHNFQLDVFFQFVKQNGPNNLWNNGTPPGGGVNQPVEVFQRWQKPGDITSVQLFSQDFGASYTAMNNLRGSDGLFTDASFIRLKNVSLSYNFPKRLVQRLRIKRTRLYVQGQNLLTITKYNGLDPENQYLGLPPLRVLTAGIQITL